MPVKSLQAPVRVSQRPLIERGLTLAVFQDVVTVGSRMLDLHLRITRIIKFLCFAGLFTKSRSFRQEGHGKNKSKKTDSTSYGHAKKDPEDIRSFPS